MKIFVTGASGFVGSAVVKELIDNGHQVLGLARSDESAQKLKQAGAEVLKGSLEDLNSLKKGALEADAIIHTAFVHDFSSYADSAAKDKQAIEAMGSVISGTNKPIVVTSGVGWIKPKGKFITEDDAPEGSPRISEAAGLELASKGIKASVVRLPPSVHDKNDHGFIPMIIETSRKQGSSAYIGEGQNQWASVFRGDAARLYRLIIEKGAGGKSYQAIGDQGIPTKQLAEVIGKELNLPVKQLSADEAKQHFGWMADFFGMDMRATAFKTKEELGWEPTGPGLIDDMKANYFN